MRPQTGKSTTSGLIVNPPEQLQSCADGLLFNTYAKRDASPPVAALIPTDKICHLKERRRYSHA
jgi:hypothetical protein